MENSNTVKIALVLVLVVAIVEGAALFQYSRAGNLTTDGSTEVVPTPTPEVDGKIVVQRQLLDIVDNLPENELDIDEKEWEKPNRVMELRTLEFFQSKGYGLEKLPDEKVAGYRQFVYFWSFPWKVNQLKTNYSDAEIKMIWENQFFLNAATPEGLAELEKTTQEKLAKIVPKVEAENVTVGQPYKIQADIDKAVLDGKLVALKGENIVTGEKMYLDKDFNAIFVANIDPQLKDVSKFLTVSSTVRDLDQQALLRKLGYPAAKSSYHNYGVAFDLRLTKEDRDAFQEYLKEVVNTATGETRFDKITKMIAAGKQPTIENLIAEKIIAPDHKLAKTYSLLKESVKDHPIAIIDESPFFTYTENGKVTVVNPVMHVQYMPTEK